MMGTFLSAILTYVSAFVISRHHLALEAVVLRQQLAVYKRKQPHPKLRRSDRLFWVVFRLMWNSWSEALILVKPDTVVAWHRAGYRLFWRWRSRRVGRPKAAEEVRHLIRRMKRENPSWGALRIHGEVLLLGFDISEPTVSRYLQRLKRNPDESKASQWLAFLNNHRSACRIRLLHRSKSLFPRAVLFLCYRTYPPANFALQRYVPSNKRLDRATTTRGIPAAGSV
jgi:putative transposase